MTYKILIVEDCPKDTRLLMDFYESSFLHCSFVTVDSFSAAKEKIKTEMFDIVSLDGILPDLCNGGLGYQLIPFIREHQQPIIIIVSSEQCYIDMGFDISKKPEERANFGFNKLYIKGQKLDEKFTLISLSP